MHRLRENYRGSATRTPSFLNFAKGWATRPCGECVRNEPLGVWSEILRPELLQEQGKSCAGFRDLL